MLPQKSLNCALLELVYNDLRSLVLPSLRDANPPNLSEITARYTQLSAYYQFWQEQVIAAESSGKTYAFKNLPGSAAEQMRECEWYLKLLGAFLDKENGS